MSRPKTQERLAPAMPRPVWIRPAQVEEYFGITSQYLDMILLRGTYDMRPDLLHKACKKVSHTVKLWNVDELDYWLRSLDKPPTT